MSNDPPDEPFLARWSRQKKLAAKRKSPVAEAPSEEDGPAIDPATLPNVQDLTADSDISVFLQKGVPEALRKLALRRMWSLDPEIRDFVEMAENQWDFNKAGGIYGLYQDLEEGSDVSLWLAQAVQSVPHREQVPDLATPPPTEPAATPSNAIEIATQHDAAAQANESTSPPQQVPSSQDAAEPCPSDPSQVAEMSAQLSPAAASVQHQAKASRRRHGGALPSLGRPILIAAHAK